LFDEYGGEYDRGAVPDQEIKGLVHRTARAQFPHTPALSRGRGISLRLVW
jgi:hypothetical protein